MSLVIEQLPAAFHRLMPELLALQLPEERRADCSQCHMIAPGGSPTSPLTFSTETRCCTYHPALPNFLAGRALARGGLGAELLRTRLAEPEGVGPEGLKAPADWVRRHQERQWGDFGNRLDLRCPLWAGGTETCSIWPDRNHICRTWFCRCDDGAAGHDAWRQLQGLLGLAERSLAEWAVAQGGAPAEGDPAVWEAWYRECAERVEAIGDADLAALRTSRLERGVAAVREALDHLEPPPMEDVLAPLVRGLESDGDRVWLWGYSPYDARSFPRTIFLLLAALDGHRRWVDALAAARERGLDLDEDGLRDLHHIGMVGPDLSSPEIEPGGRTRHITFFEIDKDMLPGEPK